MNRCRGNIFAPACGCRRLCGCFLVLKFWLNLQSTAAAFAAAVSAGFSIADSIFGTALGLIKTTLEIEKLRRENRKLKREETAATRIVKSPTPDEIEKFALRRFVVDPHEEKLPRRE